MCECKTKSGVLCKKKPRPGSRFCYIHRNCDSSKKTSVKKVKATSSSDSTGFQVIQKRVTRKKTGKPVQIVAPEIDYGHSEEAEVKIHEAEVKIHVDDLKHEPLCEEVKDIIWQTNGAGGMYQYFKQQKNRYRYLLSTNNSAGWWSAATKAYNRLNNESLARIEYDTCTNVDEFRDEHVKIGGTKQFRVYSEPVVNWNRSTPIRELIEQKKLNARQAKTILTNLSDILVAYNNQKVMHNNATVDSVYVDNGDGVTLSHCYLATTSNFKGRQDWNMFYNSMVKAIQNNYESHVTAPLLKEMESVVFPVPLSPP